MALIKSRPLAVLDRLYNLVGAQTPTSMEVDTPVQIVHDVSREAELSGYGPQMGYGMLIIVNTHAGASTERQAHDPYATGIGTNVDPQLTDAVNQAQIWLCSVTPYVSTIANLTRLTVAIGTAANTAPPAAAETSELVTWTDAFSANAYVPASNFTATGDIDIPLPMKQAQGAANSPFPPGLTLTRTYPLPILHGQRITLRSVSGGATNIGIYCRVWIGRKGTTPPGMR